MNKQDTYTIGMIPLHRADFEGKRYFLFSGLETVGDIFPYQNNDEKIIACDFPNDSTCSVQKFRKEWNRYAKKHDIPMNKQLIPSAFAVCVTHASDELMAELTDDRNIKVLKPLQELIDSYTPQKEGQEESTYEQEREC